MTRPVRAFVALGGNVGDRRARLEGGLSRLAATPGVRVAAVSAAYENPAVGGPPQDVFWNAVAEAWTTLPSHDFWRRLRAIEHAEGRVRAERHGPRTLDLDLLAFDGVVQGDTQLTLPHPEALARAFTLQPWSDIAPDAVVPGTGAPVVVHVARLLGREPEAFDALTPVALLRPTSSAAAPRPTVLKDRAALSAWRGSVSGTVGFVPTMGALHEGHAALVRRARAACDRVLASVFVNPLQFGPSEDFTRYPRTFEADLDLLAREGADAVYAPDAGDLYPEGFSTAVEVGGPSQGFEGAARPGHFRGVATVVAKLLQRTRADQAFFGRKDAQQAAVIRRLVRDLDLPTEVVVAPTVRDLDGLALSSRNRYLSPGQRTVALGLPAALDRGRRAAAGGEREASRILGAVLARLAADPGRTVEYVGLVDAEGYRPVERLGDAPALLVAAVRVGTTRLLDNAWVAAPAPEPAP